ncbi:MAG: phosphotransferase [Clostridia bacterium]|nr:phosphotransferase [Clostridia bacterium]
MIYEKLTRLEEIKKGWSGDKKYPAVDSNGNQYLLRIAPQARMERRMAGFTRSRLAAQLNIPCPQPLECGVCAEGIYTIESWIEGSDAEAVISSLPENKQYAYGLDAGRILKAIHSLPAPADAPDWEDYFSRKIDRKIAMYESCPLKYEGGEAMLHYLRHNRHLLKNRPQTYQHGDYHIGNMMVDSGGRLVIIDFDKDDYGDPWEEFNRIAWCAQAAPYFAAGMVDGYFDCAVPSEFWSLLALYICSNSLGSLPWAIPFGDGEIQTMQNQAADILQWYDGMNRIIPSWYRRP